MRIYAEEKRFILFPYVVMTVLLFSKKLDFNNLIINFNTVCLSALSNSSWYLKKIVWEKQDVHKINFQETSKNFSNRMKVFVKNSNVLTCQICSLNVSFISLVK